MKALKQIAYLALLVAACFALAMYAPQDDAPFEPPFSAVR